MKQLATGLRPLTRAERKRLVRENAEALFPSVALHRYEATCVALEARLNRSAGTPNPGEASHSSPSPTTLPEPARE